MGEIYLGHKDFVRHRRPRARRSNEVPRRPREPIPCSLKKLLRTRSADALVLADREHGYSLREIAAVLGVHHTTVSRRLKAPEQQAPSVR